MASSTDREIIETLRETMQGFNKAGAVDRGTFEQFERQAVAALEEISPSEIRKLRRREAASQATFAMHLGVSKGLVSQWERGTRRPGGSSLKLLNLVKRKGLAWISV